jgi:hypothetical protein
MVGKRIPLLGALTLCGCAHAMIDAHADDQIEASRAETYELRRSSTCPGGVQLGPSCGFVVERARMADFRENFRVQKCEGVEPPACDVLLDGAIDRWVRQRYSLAIVADVDARCERREDKCEDALVWEKLMMSSHNDTLSGASAGRENAINDRRDREHAEQTARDREAALLAAAATLRANAAAPPPAPVTVVTVGVSPYAPGQYNPFTHHVNYAPALPGPAISLPVYTPAPPGLHH